MRRPAFTLVEMLVSVAIVLLMMLLFAEIFRLATSSMTTQRGIAENDQRARSAQTVIKADLDSRTFKRLVPFPDIPIVAPNPFPLPPDNTSQYRIEDIPQPDRAGYFYVSENNPDDDSDDVLAFTVRMRTDQPERYGRGLSLTDAGEFVDNRNQPDFDDGIPVSDNTATSRLAEVVYFMRNGNLYRRVLLIRQQSEGISSQPSIDNYLDTSASPPSITPVPGGSVDPFALPAAVHPITGNPWYPLGSVFWTDYDFAVHSTFNATTGANSGVEFLGEGDLDNFQNVLASSPLSRPENRFGFNPSPPATGVADPREYVPGPGRDRIFGNADDVPFFIGRFTLAECSHFEFLYPQEPMQRFSDGTFINDGNPMLNGASSLPIHALWDTSRDRHVIVHPGNDDNAGTQYGLTLNDDVELRGPRRGQDVLLPNVTAFDVKVWDSALNRYVDIGKADAGDYGRDNNNHAASGFLYGPRGNIGTGDYNLDNNVFDTWHWAENDDAPYRPLKTNRAVPPSGYDWTPPPGWATWSPGNAVSVGDNLLPLNADDDRSYYYRCISAPSGVQGIDPDTSFPRRAGQQFTDSNGNVYVAVANYVPMKSIQITIRYNDITSGLNRQLTIVRPLLSEEQ